MEIHKAAQQYADHQDILLNQGHYRDDVWKVAPFSDGGYILMLSMRVLSALPGYSPGSALDAELGFITRQRGGTRVFKTLEAVLSALEQIGQPKVTLPTTISRS